MRKQGDSSMVGEDLRDLLYCAERYLRLEAADKVTVVCASIVLWTVALVLALCSMYFIGKGLVATLTWLLGSEILSYFCVGGGLLLIVLLLILCRKFFIERPILRFISKKLLGGKMLTERIVPRRYDERELHELAKRLAEELREAEKGGEE